MVKTTFYMIDGIKHSDIIFENVDDIEGLRTWLNQRCNFVNIGERTVINTQQIIRIVIQDNE